MSRPALTLVVVMTLVVGCSSDPPDSGPGASPSDNTPTTADGGQTTTSPGTSGGTPSPGQGGFEIDRVRLFDPADLPVNDVPVPVPWGGEARYLEEFTSGATVLLVSYDAQFFGTAAAFYQTWIAQEGLEVTESTTLPTFARWTVVIDGEEVTIEVNQSSENPVAQLTVTFGGE